jgi:hypothetical protein
MTNTKNRIWSNELWMKTDINTKREFTKDDMDGNIHFRRRHTNLALGLIYRTLVLIIVKFDCSLTGQNLFTSTSTQTTTQQYAYAKERKHELIL